MEFIVNINRIKLVQSILYMQYSRNMVKNTNTVDDFVNDLYDRITDTINTNYKYMDSHENILSEIVRVMNLKLGIYAPTVPCQFIWENNFVRLQIDAKTSIDAGIHLSNNKTHSIVVEYK